MPDSIESREVRLAHRPTGRPTPDAFTLATRTLQPPGEGEVLVENLYLSVDPYMRGRMVDRKSYVPPFQVGAPLDGGAVGRVLASHSPHLAEGDHVLHNLGWRTHAVLPAKHAVKVDPDRAPMPAYLGTLGMPGLTAYVGLLDVGRPQEGETVFVSGAAGAVGSVVCQIARLKGCRVVGSAGSDAKTAWLRETAGVDETINYKTDDLRAALREAAPDGVDVYFDNVGGDHLEAALGAMNRGGRAVLCGMIAQYNATEPPCAPRNLAVAIGKRLRLEGFIVSDHFDRREAFLRDMAGWIGEGKLRWEETVVDGLEAAPDAFLGLFEGENLGKMVVKLG